MKIKSHLIFFVVALTSFAASSQGTFVYDQQSSMLEGALPYGAGGAIQQMTTPYGQSFIPTLSAVDFFRLNLNDNNPSNNLGATVYVNLRTNSISGPILATTALVTLTNGFTGVVNFFFSGSKSLTPGTTYYFQPVVQSGDVWNIAIAEYGYPNGSAFNNGSPVASDYWFREGIVVPEPSVSLLVVLGGGVVAWRHRKK